MDIKVAEDVSAEYLSIVNDILKDADFRKLALYIQHLRTTRLIHSLNVSYLSWKICQKGWAVMKEPLPAPDFSTISFSTNSVTRSR